MRKNALFMFVFISLFAVHFLSAQPGGGHVRHDTTSSCSLLEVREYSYKRLVNEGVRTLDRQLDVLHVPILQFQGIIKGHIKRHRFELNKGGGRVNKIPFLAVSFSYPSVSPQGDPVTLSGLVTFPALSGNRPSRMLIYHRILATSNKIAPSNSLPLEAVLSADNTICVFPDYYGCGITEGAPLPFIALNYHARCATECALHALDIVRDYGIDLAEDFHTWTSGYSQGGGYALATHRYIETSLPDSLAHLLNLRWSFCGGGIYTPIELYEYAVLNKEMGSSPAVFLQALRSTFNSHKDKMDTLSVGDFLSRKALELGLDSILSSTDDGLWDLYNRIGVLGKSHDPADYFHPMVIDTSLYLFKKYAEVTALDDCVSGWNPQAPIVLLHSKKDKCIPYQLAEKTYNRLSVSSSGCSLRSPSLNGSHAFTSVLYFAKLLRLREDEIFNKLSYKADKHERGKTGKKAVAER